MPRGVKVPKAAPCFTFSHWDGDARGEPRIILRPDADLTLTAVFRGSCPDANAEVPKLVLVNAG